MDLHNSGEGGGAAGTAGAQLGHSRHSGPTCSRPRAGFDGRSLLSVVLQCSCAWHACPAPTHLPSPSASGPSHPCPAAVEYLATRGYDPAFGARPVKRVVQQELETALAKGILRGDFAVSLHGWSAWRQWPWHCGGCSTRQCRMCGGVAAAACAAARAPPDMCLRCLPSCLFARCAGGGHCGCGGTRRRVCHPPGCVP
jgi:hypothetical protein